MKNTIRFLLAASAPFALVVSGCSLVTVPIKTAGSIVTTTVKTTGKVVEAPFKAAGGGYSESEKPDSKQDGREKPRD